MYIDTCRKGERFPWALVNSEDCEVRSHGTALSTQCREKFESQAALYADLGNRKAARPYAETTRSIPFTHTQIAVQMYMYAYVYVTRVCMYVFTTYVYIQLRICVCV